MRPKALILSANGTNRDGEAAHALELAGAQAEIVPLSLLRRGKRRWQDYQILVVPGGFSYADSLGAGKLLALDLQVYFSDEIQGFVAGGKPVLGICNGFQALVKSGLLPDPLSALSPGGQHLATLTYNASGRFECRWVTLAPLSERCIWTRDLAEPIECPVAHGEGRFVPADPAHLDRLRCADQIALIYAHPDGHPAAGVYPFNPNGSSADIAGVCNPSGNILGLMPHPEDHISLYQHPRWTRGEEGRRSGLALFINGVRYASDL